jgi:hypothetical protein
MDATQSIKEHLNPKKKSKGSSPWRSENFVPGVALPCGCENFSPAAFPQGHTVCVTLLLLLDLVLNAVSRQSLEKLTTSRSLRTESAQSWLQKIVPVEQLLDKLVGAVSPKLHQAVSEAMKKLGWDQLQIGSKTWAQSKIAEIARCWPGVMPGISVISNHASICHLDINGHKEWYDFLVAAGTYKECWFRLPDLGLLLKYLPGTVVALNRRILRHEVVKWDGGDRVCYAHWVRPTLLRALSVNFPSWVTQSEYI